MNLQSRTPNPLQATAERPHWPTALLVAIWLGSVTLPPRGGRTKAHLHENHETALYLISGDEVELWMGEHLEHKEIARPGDYIYIPAGVPHVAVNRTETPAAFVAARTDPNEQESVVMRPDLEARVP